MQDNNFIADICYKFGVFCTQNSRVVAQRIRPFFLAGLLFLSTLNRAWRRGRGRGGTVADMGICKACLPSGVANLVFDRWGTQFFDGTDEDLGIESCSFRNNCKSAPKLAILLQVTCLFL